MDKRYKHIGIIVAMQKELNLLVPLISNLKETTIAGTKFYTGEIEGCRVTVMQCGIGKVNSALGTIKLIENFDIDIVINSGVAGGADPSINIMDVVIGERVAYHDVWCGPGTTYGQADGCPKYFALCDNLKSVAEAMNFPGKRVGLICSGDIFVDSKEIVDGIKSHFPDALAVDMESASISQTCYLAGIPCVILRVISDSPGASKNNSVQYQNFWEDAPKHTFNVLLGFIKNLQN